METEPAAYPATSLAIRRRGMGYQPISMRRVSNVDRPVYLQKIRIALQLQASYPAFRPGRILHDIEATDA
jgi:hypothetical protein